MTRMIAMTLAALLVSAPGARADLRLSQLVGRWAGTGIYHEGVSSAEMRCRLTFEGSDAQVSLGGRCGSSLGSQKVAVILSRGADGAVTMTAAPGAPPVDSDVEVLRGTPGAAWLELTGAAGPETVRMVFQLQADGSLRFATERKWQTGRSRSLVDMVRR